MHDPHAPEHPHPTKRHWLWAGACSIATALLAACGVAPGRPPAGGTATASAATTARAYRQDAARHIYQHNAARIYLGSLPPMLYAVGVLEVYLDRRGNVQNFHWLRAPRHAPEVIQEIERTIRAASPLPAPAQVKDRLSWTDTWLWDRSGKFQLDTLTEGQRSGG